MRAEPGGGLCRRRARRGPALSSRWRGCGAGEFARSRRAPTARGRGPVVPRGRLTDCASSAGSARVPVPEGPPVCPPSPRPRVAGDGSGVAETPAEPQVSGRDEGRGVGGPVAVRPPRCSLRAPRTTDRATRPRPYLGARCPPVLALSLTGFFGGFARRPGGRPRRRRGPDRPATGLGVGEAPSGAWGVRATGSVESLPEREWRRPRVGRRARRDTSRAGAGKGRHPTGIGGPARPAHSRGRHEEPEGRILAALLP